VLAGLGAAGEHRMLPRHGCILRTYGRPCPSCCRRCPSRWRPGRPCLAIAAAAAIARMPPVPAQSRPCKPPQAKPRTPPSIPTPARTCRTPPTSGRNTRKDGGTKSAPQLAHCPWSTRRSRRAPGQLEASGVAAALRLAVVATAAVPVMAWPTALSSAMPVARHSMASLAVENVERYHRPPGS